MVEIRIGVRLGLETWDLVGIGIWVGIKVGIGVWIRIFQFINLLVYMIYKFAMSVTVSLPDEQFATCQFA